MGTLEEEVETFLRVYAPAAKKLSLAHILPVIGFRHAKGYIDEIKQVVEAEYGEELFDKLPLPDGSVYNVALDVPGTLGFEKKLQTALEPLRNKLRGLCSGSYKGFGKQRDKKVSVVLDLSELTNERRPSYARALTAFVSEQLGVTERFNVIRAEAYVTSFLFHEAEETTPETLGAAVAYVEGLRPLGDGESPDTLDAVQYGLDDPSTDAVLLITDGPRAASARLIKQRAGLSGKRVNTVALGVTDGPTVTLLRAVAHETAGLFHVYAGPVDNIADDTGVERAACDSVPLKRLRNEIAMATRTLALLRSLVEEAQAKGRRPTQRVKDVNPDDLSVTEWIELFGGVSALKLRLVDLLPPPRKRLTSGIAPGSTVTAESEVWRKAGVPLYTWPSGESSYAFLTDVMAQGYTQRAEAAMDAMLAKVGKLRLTTHAAFGSLQVGTEVVVLLAAGDSMEPGWSEAVRLLRTTVKQQFRGACPFNLVAFGGEIESWRPDVVPGATTTACNEALRWLGQLRPSGQPDLAAGIAAALASCHGTLDGEAGGKVFLVVDDAGVPEGGPARQAAQRLVRDCSLEFSVVSFFGSADDKILFLQELAAAGGGDFRYFGRDDAPAGVDVPADIRLMQREIELLQTEMDSVEELRATCRRCEAEATAAAVAEKASDTGTFGDSRSLKSNGSRDPLRTKTAAEMRRDRAVARGDKRPAWESYSQPSKYDPPPPEVKPEPWRPSSPQTHGSTAEVTPSAEVAALEENFSAKPSHISARPAPRRPKTKKHKPVTSDKTLAGLPKEVALRLRQMTRPAAGKELEWLETHAHTALQLTVGDALEATAIRRKGTFVPSLGKYVYPRVFDDAFSHCRVLDSTKAGPVYRLSDLTSGSTSASSQPELVYVFPEAANLKTYHSALEDVLFIYEEVLTGCDPDDGTTADPDALVETGTPAAQALRAEIAAATASLTQFAEVQAELDNRAFPLALDPPSAPEEESPLWAEARKTRRARRRLANQQRDQLYSDPLNPYRPTNPPARRKSRSGKRPQPQHPFRPRLAAGMDVMARAEGSPFFYLGRVVAAVRGAATIEFRNGHAANVLDAHVVPLPEAVGQLGVGDAVIVPAVDVGNGAYLAGTVTAVVDPEVEVTSVSGATAAFLPQKLMKIGGGVLAATAEVWEQSQPHSQAGDHNGHSHAQSTPLDATHASASGAASPPNPGSTLGGTASTLGVGRTLPEANLSMSWDYAGGLRVPGQQAPPTSTLTFPAQDTAATATQLGAANGVDGAASLQWDGGTLHDLIGTAPPPTSAAAAAASGAEDPDAQTPPLGEEYRGRPRTPNPREGFAAALVRWGEDGWYYPGSVRVDSYQDGAPTCQIEQDGVADEVSTSSVILCQHAALAPRQKVLCEHPYQRESYAPGEVIRVDPGGAVVVKFFDAVEAKVYSHQGMAFGPQAIDPETYQRVVDGIVALEMEMVGKHVLCRSETNFLFYPGVVAGRIHSGFLQVTVADECGGRMDQLQNHIFPIPPDNAVLRGLAAGEGVLVINMERGCCEPAAVLGGEDVETCTYNVRCWDGREVRATVICLIGVEYYDFAVKILEFHNKETQP